MEYSDSSSNSAQNPLKLLCISFSYIIVVSFFEGVSCDACLKGNFSGKRYKCLICYDYDLCAACYEANMTSTHHSLDHPMQCILTRADFGMFILV